MTNKHQIRLAKSVREGTWGNREPARLVVSGNKPRRMPKDTTILAQVCDSSDVQGAPPSSDDDPASDEPNIANPSDPMDDASDDEEEEEVECLHPTSLVGVILDGTEDLLTLEEAYNTLTMRLRETLYDMGPPTAAQDTAFNLVCHPILEEAPAMVRAMQRDLQRLMGKVPSAETDAVSSPFRPPSSSNNSPRKRLPSPDQTPRRGYTESEVRYRRESAGVGCAVLRFLACIFNSPRLFHGFSEVDLESLLDLVLVIPKSPTLPTPSPKRTYTLAMIVLSHLRLATSMVQRSQQKIAAAIEAGLVTIGTGSFPLKDPSPIRKEAFNAWANLLRMYPSTFFLSYPQLLPPCLRALASPIVALRKCAAATLAAVIYAKQRLAEEADQILGRGPIDAHERKTKRQAISKSEAWTSSFLKSSMRTYTAGEKRNEWMPIETTFRQTVGSADQVAWACTTWALLVTLLGQEYNACSLAPLIEHIMDRSMRPSTNPTRPTLAATAWQHAIYAYLMAGSSTSVSEEGRLIRSYNPFIGSAAQDSTARVKTISLPVQFALEQANGDGNVSFSYAPCAEFNGEVRGSWQRAEKSKKFAWMVTTGLTAPAVVYAYSVVALNHQDPSAKELSKISGMPSSDGAVAEMTPEERRLPNFDRLDRTFDLVLMPTLQQFFAIRGVDRLKNAGWEIFQAVTAAEGKAKALDRLLCERYLAGDVIGMDKVLPETIAQFEKERIAASEIPGWGRVWVAKRLGKLMSLFQEAFNGIRGISELSAVQWVTNAEGVVLLPMTLSNVWRNLMQGIASSTLPDGGPTPLFVCGLQVAAQQIVSVMQSDPAVYIPVCLLNEEGKSTLNTDAIRLGIAVHLVDVAVEVLGATALGSTRLDSSPLNADESQITEDFGTTTFVSIVLHQVLRQSDFSFPLDVKVNDLLQQLVGTLLRTGASSGTRLLGEVSNAMPWIFEAQEQTQLDVWRMLAQNWASTIDLSPSDSASTTNHTGALLVSLLSGPFRNRNADSIWYIERSTDIRAAWDELLRVTVLRFRAKRAGSNFGVLETLAAHIEDFISIDDENGPGTGARTKARMASETTLHCLAVATGWISFVQPEHYHSSHYSINENYVPTDWLTLLANCLDAAYECGTHPSEGVDEIVQQLIQLFRSLRPNNTVDVLEPLRPALEKWMTDASENATGILAASLDDLYVAIVSALARAIENGDIERSSATMNSYIDQYAPRLGRTESPEVPAAFQDFWKRTFQGVPGLDFSDDVAGFLHSLRDVDKTFITANGLSTSEESQTQEDTQESAFEPALPDVEDALAVEEPVPSASADEPNVIQTSADYDADVSQSQQSSSKKRRRSEIVPQSTPLAEKTERTEVPASTDVFGPKRKTRSRKNARKGKSRSVREVSSSDSVRSASPSSELLSTSPGPNPNDTVIAETEIEDNGNSDDRPFPPSSSSAQRPETFFGSASRWLRKVPSLGSLFAAGHDTSEAHNRSASAPNVLVAASPGESDHSPEPSPLHTKTHRRKKSRRSERVRIQEPEPEPEPQPEPEVSILSPELEIVELPPEKAAFPAPAEEPEPELEPTQVDTQQQDDVDAAPAITRSAARRKRQQEVESSNRPSKRRRRSERNTRSETPQSQASSKAEEEVDESSLTARERRRLRRARSQQEAQPEPELEPTQQQSEQSTSGKFDDAPGDVTPVPTRRVTRQRSQAAPSPSPEAPPSPDTPRRSETQTHVLGLVTETLRHTDAIRSLEMDDLVSFLAGLDELRAHATANLQARADEQRREREEQRRVRRSRRK